MQSDFTTTPVYNSPMLLYPSAGLHGSLQIPIHITDYKTPIRQTKVNTINTLPRLGGGNVAYDSSFLQPAGVELPLITLQGWIQTPTTASGTNSISALTYTEGGVTSNVTFIERMAAYMEGRASNTIPWSKVDPTWFRDPYGRVFSSPKVIGLTGSYMEAVPGRTNFNLTLQI